MKKVLVRICWAKDWNGQGVAIGAGTTGTVEDNIFTTSNRMWAFPVGDEDYADF